ncbi:MAG: hypothetical protein EA402_01320 [Planctomycetota bacterium]|nr:MAG: hypothetical protein EA402_01320 [Planctomycetota bacterium]
MDEAKQSNQHRPRNAFIDWASRHDDSWLFVVSYLGLAIVLSVFLSLFWLLVLVAIHGWLEWLRHSQSSPDAGFANRLACTSWAVKLDLALVLLALALSVYMEVIMGAVGLGQAARLGTHSAARFAAWTRLVRGLVLTIDEGAQVLRVGLTKGKESHAQLSQPWKHWGWEDHLGIWLSAACIASVLIAPLVTSMHMGDVLHILGSEMIPFPATPAVESALSPP